MPRFCAGTRHIYSGQYWPRPEAPFNTTEASVPRTCGIDYVLYLLNIRDVILPLDAMPLFAPAVTPARCFPMHDHDRKIARRDKMARAMSQHSPETR